MAATVLPPLNEVRCRIPTWTPGWELCFQEVNYRHDDGSPTEHGFRFIWHGPNGYQAARGQARIPNAAALYRLIGDAKKAGWFL